MIKKEKVTIEEDIFYCDICGKQIGPRECMRNNYRNPRAEMIGHVYRNEQNKEVDIHNSCFDKVFRKAFDKYVRIKGKKEKEE